MNEAKTLAIRGNLVDIINRRTFGAEISIQNLVLPAAFTELSVFSAAQAGSVRPRHRTKANVRDSIFLLILSSPLFLIGVFSPCLNGTGPWGWDFPAPVGVPIKTTKAAQGL